MLEAICPQIKQIGFIDTINPVHFFDCNGLLFSYADDFVYILIGDTEGKAFYVGVPDALFASFASGKNMAP